LINYLSINDGLQFSHCWILFLIKTSYCAPYFTISIRPIFSILNKHLEIF
tara:strand:- start:54495 stop:54644 length:150 start_codon:yes stop_codon:yes gene_type:complete